MKEKKPTIGILTTFYNFAPEFSLTNVVKHQLKAFRKHGYKTVLFVLENFDDDDAVPEGVEIRKILPQLKLEPYTANDFSNIEQDAEKVKVAMEEHMADIDVCLTHDIIFINSYLPYNVGMNRAIIGKLNHVRWLHWMHSGPSNRPAEMTFPRECLYTLPDNSFWST